MRFDKKRAERCYNAIQAFYERPENNFQTAEIRYSNLADLMYAVKLAAEAVGLKYFRGCIYTNNN